MIHRCPRYMNPSQLSQAVVNRVTRRIEAMCNACGFREQIPNGEGLFAWWAQGYIDATRDAAHQVITMPTPERQSWGEKYDAD